MNKKGVIQFVAIIVFVLIVTGFLYNIEYRLPNVIKDFQEDVCYSIDKQGKICFNNETGIFLVGKFNNLELELTSQGVKKSCYIGSGDFNGDYFCKSNFGYVYENQDFEIIIKENGEVVDVITKSILENMLINLLKNPKFLGAGVIKLSTGELFLAVDGVRYILEKMEESENK